MAKPIQYCKVKKKKKKNPAQTLGTLSMVIYHIYVKLHVISDFKNLIMFTNQLTLSHI